MKSMIGKEFLSWLLKAPFTYLWNPWSKTLTVLDIIALFIGLFGYTIGGWSVYLPIGSGIFFGLLLCYSFLRSVYELYSSREELRSILKPKVYIEAEPTRRISIPGRESQYVVAKIINNSPAVRIERCYARITDFDQILEDGRTLRNIGMNGSDTPRTQGADVLEDSFSPAVVQWSANELDAQHQGIYYDFQREASLDIAVIEGSDPRFLMLVTANPTLRQNFSYLFNLPDQYYRLVLEVASINSPPVRRAFKLIFTPRLLTQSGLQGASLSLENMEYIT